MIIYVTLFLVHFNILFEMLIRQACCYRYFPHILCILKNRCKSLRNRRIISGLFVNKYRIDKIDYRISIKNISIIYFKIVFFLLFKIIMHNFLCGNIAFLNTNIMNNNINIINNGIYSNINHKERNHLSFK